MNRQLKGTDGYGLICDNLLGYSEGTLRRLLNLYALLYGRILVSDSWLITNQALISNLCQRSGVELLREGIIVPVRRDSVQSFQEFLTQCQAKKMHGLSADLAYIQFLDRTASAMETFAMADVAAGYKEMSQRILEPAILVRLGISEPTAQFITRLIQGAKDSGVDTNTNSFLKDHVQPRLPVDEQVRFWDIARSPYALNLPNVLGTGIIGQKDFRGDEILAVLHDTAHQVGDVQVLTSDVNNLHDGHQSMHAEINDSLICWLFSDEVLESMSPEELAAARSTSDRDVYLEALSQEVTAHNPMAWQAYISAFEGYFRTAANTVFQMRAKTGAFGKEPIPGSVLVSSDGRIHIKPPEGHVVMNGIGGGDIVVETGKKIVVVGREITIPEPAAIAS